MRVIEVRITKKWVTLYRISAMQTLKVRPAEYKEIFIRPLHGDWPYLKKVLRQRRDLYDRKGKRYAEGLVKKILAHNTRKRDEEV